VKSISCNERKRQDICQAGPCVERRNTRSIARPNQLAPECDWWTVWLLCAGRGFGKSRSAAEWVREQVTAGGAKRVALVGATAADVRDIMVEGPSGLLTITPDWDRPSYEPSKRRITFQNGAVATLFSAEEADRLRGQNSDCAWCDEICSWSNQQATWDQLMFGLRVGVRPRVCVSTTPKPSKLLRDLVSREGKDVVVTRGTSYENRGNLAPAFFASIVKKYEGSRLGRQELSAELLEDVRARFGAWIGLTSYVVIRCPNLSGLWLRLIRRYRLARTATRRG
jgi:phage terminase large subunit-like protein